MIKYLALTVALTFIVLIAVMATPAAAQNVNNTEKGELQVNATSGEPMLQQKSDKGIYNVLLKWPTVIVDPEPGIQVEIVFLNASAPAPTVENIPQRETSLTGQSTPGASGFNVPGIMEATLPVKSYDMAIYDGGGKELWKKVNQPSLGGRGTQDIMFEGKTTGPLTIKITNIRSGWDLGQTSTAEDLTDSVTFTTAVVPEFPLIPLILASSMATAIVTMHIRSTRRNNGYSTNS